MDAYELTYLGRSRLHDGGDAVALYFRVLAQRPLYRRVRGGDRRPRSQHLRAEAREEVLGRARARVSERNRGPAACQGSAISQAPSDRDRMAKGRRGTEPPRRRARPPRRASSIPQVPARPSAADRPSRGDPNSVHRDLQHQPQGRRCPLEPRPTRPPANPPPQFTLGPTRRATRLMRLSRAWCNWQHSWFWSSHWGFESSRPNHSPSVGAWP